MGFILYSLQLNSTSGKYIYDGKWIVQCGRVNAFPVDGFCLGDSRCGKCPGGRGMGPAGQELIIPDLTYVTQGLFSCQQEVVMGSDGHEEVLRG